MTNSNDSESSTDNYCKNVYSLSMPELTKIDTQKICTVPLIPVDCSFGIVTEKKVKTAPMQQVVRRERKVHKANVTVVFVVRRPGCGACRHDGRHLSSVVQKFTNVHAIGVIKEINVDNDALLDFYNTYYKYPIFKDENWILYKKILGNRTIPIWKLLATFPKMCNRYRKNKIVNVPFGGDIFTQGGILIFDKDLVLRNVFYENYSQALNVQEIYSAIEDAQCSLSPLLKHVVSRRETLPLHLDDSESDTSSKKKDIIRRKSIQS